MNMAAPWWRYVIPRFSIQTLLLLTAGVAVAASVSRNIQAPVVQYRAECAIVLEQRLNAAADETVPSDQSLQGFTSPNVLQAVVKRKEIAAAAEFRGQRDAANQLAQQLELQPAGDSIHCRLAYQSGDADTAAKVVDAVIEEYARAHNCRVRRQGMLIRVVAL